MNKQAAALSYRIRFTALAFLFRQLSLVLALLTAPLIPVTLLFGEPAPCCAYVGLVGLLLAAWWALRHLPPPVKIQHNEAFVLTAGIFLFTSLIMSLPLMFAGLSFVDALFEATSGITTTGLSTVADLERASPSFLFTRAWLQWCGGLGIVVFSLALVVHPGVLAKGLALAEAKEFGTLGGAHGYARRVLVVYVVLTLVATLVLLVLSGNAFDAVTHSLSAVSTGGFSPHDDSLAHLNGPTAVAVTLFGLAGSLPLLAYARVYEAGWREAWANLQVPAILLANLVSVAVLTATFVAVDGQSWAAASYHGPLLALSAQTTTGFSTLPPASLSHASLLVMIGAMLIGGGVGSTAGGIKVLRALILWRMVRNLVTRTCLPAHAVLEPSLAGRQISVSEIREAAAIGLLFVGLIAVSWLPFLAWGEPPMASLFEVVSATGTVGLSAGVTRPDLPIALKLVLCLDMLMGRVEIFAFLVVLHRWTWLGKRSE